MPHPYRIPFALLLALSACTPDSGRTRGDTGVSRSEASCTVEEVDRRHPRLSDGTYVYVEPAALLPAPGGYLIAGQPTFLSRVNDDGVGSLVADRPFFGAFVRGDVVMPLAHPPGVGRIGALRGVRTTTGYSFVFDEVEEDAHPTAPPLRVLYGELDPEGRWVLVQELPEPESRGLQTATWATVTSRTGEGRLSIITSGPGAERHVIGLTRDGSGWETELLWPRWVDEAALRHVAGREWLVVAGLDPGLGTGLAAVRAVAVPTGPMIGRRADVGDAPQLRVAEPPESRPWHLRAAGSERLDIGWLRARSGVPSSAWLVRGAETGTASPERLAPISVQFATTTLSDTTTLWITDEPDGLGLAGTSSLGFTIAMPARAVRSGALTSPFKGPFAALPATTDTVWVVGPEAGFGPVGYYVRSLVLRVALSCT